MVAAYGKGRMVIRLEDYIFQNLREEKNKKAIKTFIFVRLVVVSVTTTLYD